MNSPNLQPSPLGAADALYDDIEYALLDLTTASIDEGVPAPAVDEFATDFLVELNRPPCRSRPGD